MRSSDSGGSDGNGVHQAAIAGTARPVCTENLSSDVVVVKSAKDGV